MAYYYDGVKCDTLAELNALRQSRGAQPVVAAHRSKTLASERGNLVARVEPIVHRHAGGCPYAGGGYENCWCGGGSSHL